MQRDEVVTYLRWQRLGVLGTRAPSGDPQAALIGYAVTDNLEILFDTLRTSRKYHNMLLHPRVSFVVGGQDERTLQYEGEAEELQGASLDHLRPLYYAVWPECIPHEQWPEITWFVVHPKWMRFTDYTAEVVQEWDF